MTAKEQLAEMAAKVGNQIEWADPHDPLMAESLVLQHSYAVLKWFEAEVNTRAEVKMLKTHKLEGMHYASMTELLKELDAAPAPASGLLPGHKDYYWPLFEHMSHAHGLTLLDSEMEDICCAVDEVRANPMAELYCNIAADKMRVLNWKAMNYFVSRQLWSQAALCRDRVGTWNENGPT